MGSILLMDNLMSAECDFRFGPKVTAGCVTEIRLIVLIVPVDADHVLHQVLIYPHRDAVRSERG